MPRRRTLVSDDDEMDDVPEVRKEVQKDDDDDLVMLDAEEVKVSKGKGKQAEEKQTNQSGKLFMVAVESASSCLLCLSC